MRYSYNSIVARCYVAGLLAAGLGSLSLGLTGCGDDTYNKAVADAPAPKPNVQLAISPTLGAFLADSVGNAVYFSALDADGANSCTSAGCTPTWPVYYGGTVRVPNGLKSSDFTSKKTADGRSQTFYKGWPLYYFAPLASGTNTREAAGQTTGNGTGGVWHVVNPNYGVVLARKAVENQTTKATAIKTFLVDGLGRTLYFFAKDDKNPSTLPNNCTGGCAAIWPAAALSAAALPSTLKTADFDSITRPGTTTTTPDGYGGTTTTTGASTQQLTYKGRPLYYFAGDGQTRGRVTGDNLNSAGDLWFVATP